VDRPTAYLLFFNDVEKEGLTLILPLLTPKCGWQNPGEGGGKIISKCPESGPSAMRNNVPLQ
jgi:hypothetical protein